jgi:hypothetical protein
MSNIDLMKPKLPKPVIPVTLHLVDYVWKLLDFNTFNLILTETETFGLFFAVPYYTTHIRSYKHWHLHKYMYSRSRNTYTNTERFPGLSYDNKVQVSCLVKHLLERMFVILTPETYPLPRMFCSVRGVTHLQCKNAIWLDMLSYFSTSLSLVHTKYSDTSANEWPC